MSASFDERGFRALWHNTSEAIELLGRSERVLRTRAAMSFDGFGHYIDALLPDEPERMRAIARTVHLQFEHLRALRQSELDPTTMPSESLTLLGRLAGLEAEAFLTLVQRDHLRLAQPASARGDAQQEVAQDSRAELLREWSRWDEDSAADM